MKRYEEAIARHLSTTRGITITPERVVVFPGAKPPIGFCQQTYCDEGDEVIYPSPGFPIYESFTRYVGATPVPLHVIEGVGYGAALHGWRLEYEDALPPCEWALAKARLARPCRGYDKT